MHGHGHGHDTGTRPVTIIVTHVGIDHDVLCHRLTLPEVRSILCVCDLFLFLQESIHTTLNRHGYAACHNHRFTRRN